MYNCVVHHWSATGRPRLEPGLRGNRARAERPTTRDAFLAEPAEADGGRHASDSGEPARVRGKSGIKLRSVGIELRSGGKSRNGMSEVGKTGLPKPKLAPVPAV